MSNRTGDGTEDFFDDWLKETMRINGYQEEIPRLLFRFVSCETKYFRHAALELLVHNRIRMSKRSEFNDPFDSSVALGEISVEEAKEFLEQVHRRQGYEPELSVIEKEVSDMPAFKIKAEERLNETLAGAGIYSLTSSVRHPLMWSHYACAHRGLAFVFEQSSETGFAAFPVRYQDNFPVMSLTDSDGAPTATITKGRDWLYEKEWRIVEPNTAGTWRVLDSKSLYGIIFGAKVSQDDMEFMRELMWRRAQAGNPGLRVYMAGIVRGKFELEFLRVSKDKLVKANLP